MCAEQDREASSHRGILVAIVLASYSMIVIDNSIVITGLPSIRDGLGFSATGLSWVQNAYALAFGGLMLLGARAGDLLGRRYVLVAGLAIFTVASLAIGLAGTPAWLIGARAVQGVGAAILAPSTLALLSTSFSEGPERNRVLGWYGAVGGITASVGLVVGGVVADLISWRAGFFINVPIGMLLIWGTMRYIVETPRRAGRFDVAGAVLSTLGVVAVVYGLIHAAEESWLHRGTALPLCTGVVLLALFLKIESRAAQPILPLRLLASRERSGANAARVLFIGAAMGFFFYVTQYLQGVLGMRAIWAGIAFFPSMLVNFLGALAAPRLARRFGNNAVLAVVMTISLTGMVWLGQIHAGSPFLLGVALPMMLVGAGMGASMALLTISGVTGVAPEDAGSASGLVGVAHQLGGALGLAVLVVVFATVSVPPDAATNVELAHRIGMAISAGAVLLAIALLLVLVFVVRRSALVEAGKGSAARLK
ncbi:MFS transporter, DHA2 family, multidrug resistance protein [Variovorax sp. YR266]|uniref:MFS transporter n=1 Tax=Variovorax sp. YR266 TaxID=1884386 RepID=UPI000895B09C|nr:MFS transporter [Variovorax sp. YR266]SDZ70775.1 MFS transporter, DHA2 family, multidrug resistance protein [Variovorax sp. YR266]